MKESWSRKVIGALKDMTSIGIAKTSNRSIFEDNIDIAVIKATSHRDIPPNEKHVLTALSATGDSGSRLRLIYALEKRLTRTRDWKVALKTLALFHRLLRDGRPAFSQDLQNFSHRSVIEEMFCFEDRSSPFASNFSLWVRKYSNYLAQRLHVSRIFNYDVALENHSGRINELDIQPILLYMPSLQQLLGFLLDCTPEEGCVGMNSLLMYALDLLVKECPNINVTINVCICELLGSFFADMPRHRALILLDIYKRYLQQSERISRFYDTCGVLLTRGQSDFRSPKKPSESVLSEMEDYIKIRSHPGSSIYLSAGEMRKSIMDASNPNSTVAGDETNCSVSDSPTLSFSDWLFTPTLEIEDNMQPQQQENNDTRPV